MIPLIWNVQYREMCRDKKESSNCRTWEGREHTVTMLYFEITKQNLEIDFIIPQKCLKRYSVVFALLLLSPMSLALAKASCHAGKMSHDKELSLHLSIMRGGHLGSKSFCPSHGFRRWQLIQYVDSTAWENQNHNHRVSHSWLFLIPDSVMWQTFIVLNC